MITRIEIDGFKTFKDFKVDLAPFQVIVGPNGSGKSNLFDALQLLSRLVEMDLISAFQDMRGDASELFTKIADGRASERIYIAVEMLVDRKIQDDWGREAELQYTHLRYELELVRYPDSYQPYTPHIKHEALKSIAPYNGNDLSDTTNIANYFIDTLSERPTKSPPKGVLDLWRPTIWLYSDPTGTGETKSSFLRDKAQRTVLNSVIDVTFPHAFAAREALRSLKLLHLNPDALRQPSSTNAPRALAVDGSNLPTTLARMQAEDKYIIGDISRDMANLVPGILKIRVERDELSDKYAIQARTSDQRTFLSHVLSDGTLRLLALATLKNDPKFHGVLCIEEPENGVDPLHLQNMVRLLRAMATNFVDSEQVEKPLRQVIVTSHSPTFISFPEVIGSLIFAFKTTRVEPQKSTFQVTRMVPVASPDQSPEASTNEERDIAMETYTIDQIKKYLESATFDNAREQLGRTRAEPHEI